MRNKDGVAAKFVGCWEIGKRLIACLDAISQFCRGLRILEFMRDILERVEENDIAAGRVHSTGDVRDAVAAELGL